MRRYKGFTSSCTRDIPQKKGSSNNMRTEEKVARTFDVDAGRSVLSFSQPYKEVFSHFGSYRVKGRSESYVRRATKDYLASRASPPCPG
ncbi:hypothetical protein WH47_05143 [Habropoda laboriosa]|uniref:Uncharacterized protein n=1 Tax=Habropoda laboriosa TaxID=597456 RepID=A0A0L7QSL3_9HYME|nr:hypothetical protein WH47_05143 [Habropoda laboriosa]